MTLRRTKVLVDATQLAPGGGLTFAAHQLAALERDERLALTIWANQRVARILGDLLASPIVRIPRNLAIRALVQQVVIPLVSIRQDVVYAIANATGVLTPKPIVVTVHNSNVVGDGARQAPNRTVHGRLVHALTVATIRRARSVIVLSESIGRDVAAHGIDAARMRLVYSGREPFHGTPRRPETAPDGPFALVLASDAPHKRLDDIAEAAAAASDREHLTVVISGNVLAERRDYLTSAAAPGSLEFVGFVEARQEVMWLLLNARFMVSAAEREAFPLPLVEAASTGCPEILADIPIHREIAGDNAHYFGLGDVPALADEMIRGWRETERRPWEWRSDWPQHARAVADLLVPSEAQTGDRHDGSCRKRP